MTMEKTGVSRAYDSGYRAFGARRGLSDCPYENPAEAKNWRDGWYDAMEAKKTEPK